MADRVSVSIAIGGNVPANLVEESVETAECESLSTEWDEQPFDISQFPTDDALRLFAHDVANGELDRMESFCAEHGLIFSRWSGAFGAEIVNFSGQGITRRFAADEEGRAVIDAAKVAELGSYDAILSYFNDADFTVPPLRIQPRTAIELAGYP